jgi:hypothetical protein
LCKYQELVTNTLLGASRHVITFGNIFKDVIEPSSDLVRVGRILDEDTVYPAADLLA